MAITSYKKNGQTFYRVYVHGRSSVIRNIRVQRSKAGIESMAEARREEKKLTRQVFEQVARIESKGITWKELVHRWEINAKNGLVGKKYSVPAINQHVNTLYNHTFVWLEKRIRDLGRSDGRYVINSLVADSYRVSSIKSIKGSINKIWNWGVEEGLISEGAKSPVHGLVVESENNKYKPILTLEEIKKLLYEAEIREHPWRKIWAVAILTGMRSGELFALTWDDVDFDNNIIRITKSYSQRIKGIKSTKNSDWRNAHISEDLKNVLIEIKSECPDGVNVLPRLGGWNCGLASNILRSFLCRIGIETYVTFHTLRACFATHVLASGVEPTKVMKMGGWADFKTFQIYIRMAGIDVKGVTDDFRVMPNLNMTDNVVKIR
ncbi:MAG: site-specific integrase [Bacteriovoracaceae bacterium]|nr:site-specific integrase [Bacteriovoracaceae bacterium]